MDWILYISILQSALHHAVPILCHLGNFLSWNLKKNVTWTLQMHPYPLSSLLTSHQYHCAAFSPEKMQLRNEFDFWKVHGIMNTSGLLQSKWSPKGFMLTLEETQSIHDSSIAYNYILL